MNLPLCCIHGTNRPAATTATRSTGCHRRCAPDFIDGGFGLNATYNVDFFNDFAISAAFVSAGNVTWDLGQGPDSQHTYTTELVQVFSGAQLRFFDGRLVTDMLSISTGADVLVLGADKNDAANITVTGIGSSLTHDNFLEIADYRPETLTIQNGGTVKTGSGNVGADPFNGSLGTVNVIGDRVNLVDGGHQFGCRRLKRRHFEHHGRRRSFKSQRKYWFRRRHREC